MQIRNFLPIRQQRRMLPSLLPPSLGGNGRAHPLSLIGREMMHMLFAENAMRKGVTNHTVIQKYIPIVLSFKNIANCMPHVLDPGVMRPDDLEQLTEGDKNLMLQAYLGALNEHDQFKLSSRVRNVTFDVLLYIKRAIPDHDQRQLYEFFRNGSTISCREALINFLRHSCPDITSELYIYESCSGNDQPPFVATFALSDELVPFGLPSLGVIASGPCGTKRQAAEELARLVLDAYHDHPQTIPVYKILLDNYYVNQIDSGRKNLGFYDFDKLAVPRPINTKVIKKNKTTKR